MDADIRIAVAGWSVPAICAAAFPREGTHLQRYAGRLSAVEINSSFYRPHLAKTYERWAASAPDDFRFAVKAPREITHVLRLVDAEGPLRRFLEETSALGTKRGPVLIQTPPSLRFEPAKAEAFFAALRRLYEGFVAFEPRHASWFCAEADATTARFSVSRVGADPAPAPGAGEPGGCGRLAYLRLHGAPKIYHSSYDEAALRSAARRLRLASATEAAAWCVFDNTAQGAAVENALRLEALLSEI